MEPLTSSWMDIKCSCKASRKRVNEFIDKKSSIENKTIYDVVDLEIAREISRDLKNTEKELDNKILYEFDSFALEDIKNSKLTDREIEVLEFRVKQHYSYERISQIFNVSKSCVYEIFLNAKKKIEKYKKIDVSEKELNKLSPQQIQIYKLINQNKTNREIAEAIHTSVDNVKKQKRKINIKLVGTKKP
ncbi:MAG: hypothetical protein N4A68_11860 [Maledivibacter sp.]|nr:hypothetical protein [Maledivibacter sp.]